MISNVERVLYEMIVSDTGDKDIAVVVAQTETENESLNMYEECPEQIGKEDTDEKSISKCNSIFVCEFRIQSFRVRRYFS